jgi:hypothetical protein
MTAAKRKETWKELWGWTGFSSLTAWETPSRTLVREREIPLLVIFSTERDIGAPKKKTFQILAGPCGITKAKSRG